MDNERHDVSPRPAIEELDAPRTTAEHSCDGDTVPVMAAAQPSLEDLALGATPGIVRSRLHGRDRSGVDA